MGLPGKDRVMSPFQVTENTCNTKSLLDYFMFSDEGMGVGHRVVMLRNATKWKVLSTLRKHLRCRGIHRGRYEEGCFSSLEDSVEMDMLIVKALSLNGLEVVRSKP